jgi:hypothetical protein
MIVSKLGAKFKAYHATLDWKNRTGEGLLADGLTETSIHSILSNSVTKEPNKRLAQQCGPGLKNQTRQRIQIPHTLAA